MHRQIVLNHKDICSIEALPSSLIEMFKSLEDWAEYNILVLLKHIESNLKIFWQTLLQRDFAMKWMNWVNVLRRFWMTTLLTWSDIWSSSPHMPDNVEYPWWCEMKLVQAVSLGFLTPAWTIEDNRHGDLLNKYLYLLIRLTWDKLKKLSSVRLI